MAGVNVAEKCQSAGWSVAIIDELPYGGTCALRGCDPKKMLRRGAEIIDAANLMRGKGIKATELQINWQELMAFKRTFTDAMPDRIENGLTKGGVETFHGTAHFTGPKTIAVNDIELEAKHIFIATGAKPRPLDFPGANYLIDSTAFLEMETLPKRILFVGGGFISFEFAHIVARAGSTARIIDHGERPLKGFDPDLVDILIQRTEQETITFHPSSVLDSIEEADEGFKVNASVNGEPKVWDFDLIVHGAGRVPAIDGLNLEAANVEVDAKGILVNEYLQSTSNPAVYAAGDAANTPGLPLTPVAVFEGKVAASNMLKGNKIIPDYRGIASTVFTIPELATVGLLESEAEAKGLDYRVKFTDTGKWYSNMRVGEKSAASKIIIDNASDKILGAHLLGPEYGELINFFSLAIKLSLKTRDLKNMVSAYPSVGSDLGSLL